jgi:cbb3-type cytochrome oxidase subunit 1
MFSTARWFIKTAIVFLIAGILSGLYMMAMKELFSLGYPYTFISAHTHIILIGFVMMMIMGVAIWFFPRPEKDDKKYKPDLIRVIYWMMTISTALRFIFEIMNGYLNGPLYGKIIFVASAGQVLSFILFFYSIWGRIRPLGSQLREAKGEKF